jgi:xanthine dehydrogenase large subunit
VATTLDAARHAAERPAIEIEPNRILDIETALRGQATSGAADPAARRSRRGDEGRATSSSAEFTVGGQEHFYLEGQIAFACRARTGDIVVHTSTQHPTEVQHICARLLGCDFNRVTGRWCAGWAAASAARRATPRGWPGAAALAAHHTGKPVKLRLPREIDMIATGKRHPFLYRYTVGFDADGPRAGARCDAGRRCRLEPRSHAGVVARALTHTDNAYWIPHFPRGRLRLQDAQAVEHRVPRLRRPQGVVVMEGRARPHRHRLGAIRSRCARSISTTTAATRRRTAEGRGQSLARLGRGEAAADWDTPPRRVDAFNRPARC